MVERLSGTTLRSGLPFEAVGDGLSGTYAHFADNAPEYAVDVVAVRDRGNATKDLARVVDDRENCHVIVCVGDAGDHGSSGFGVELTIGCYENIHD